MKSKTMTSDAREWMVENWQLVLALASFAAGTIVWSYSTFALSAATDQRFDRQGAFIKSVSDNMNERFDKLNDKIDDQTKQMINILREK